MGNKAKANLKKHQVDFADAVTIFNDDFAITIEDDRHDEERFVTIGRDSLEQSIRIISARKATSYERNYYEVG